MALFISASAFESNIARHLGPVILPTKSKKVSKKKHDSISAFKKRNLVDLILQTDLKKVIELPIIYLMMTRWLNNICRSTRVRKILNYRDRSIERLESSLDI